MIIRQTLDIEKIKAVFADPDIYDRIGDDGSPHIDDYEPHSPSNDSLYLTDENDTGIAFFHRRNSITLEVHFAVLKKNRHKAVRFGNLVKDWIWDNTTIIKMVATIPSLYPDVVRFCKKIGLKEEGISKDSFIKNGVLYDRVYLGIGRKLNG